MSAQDNEIQLRCEVLLALQDALIGIVTPNLRGVSVSWTDSHISGEFIYDGAISEFEEDLVSEAETYVISHFTDLTVDLFAKVVTAAVNLNQVSNGTWVYRRLERFEITAQK